MKREKSRKRFACEYCDDSNKNKYQRVTSPIWRHLTEIECKQEFDVQDDALTKEVNERLEKWRLVKEAKKNERTHVLMDAGRVGRIST